MWTSSLYYYCKYGGMDNKDRYVGLSLDIATANKKLVAATRSFRSQGDFFCGDDVNEGSSTEPAMMSLMPEGRFVLTANTEKMGEFRGALG